MYSWASVSSPFGEGALEWDWEELELVVDQAEEDKREEGEKETELAREVAESAGESRSV
jgi:hypothetical protein